MAFKEQCQRVIAKLVGTRNEIEDVLNLCSPALILSPKERDALSAAVRTLDGIARRVETDS
jgi:hypothetical protein